MEAAERSGAENGAADYQGRSAQWNSLFSQTSCCVDQSWRRTFRGHSLNL